MKHIFLYLTILLSFNFSAQAEVKCSELFKNNLLNSEAEFLPEGLFLTSKDSNRTAQYILNSKIAYMQFRSIIKKYINAKSFLFKPTEYLSYDFLMDLKKIHSLVLVGENNINGYDHPGSGNYGFNTNNINAGHLRDFQTKYIFNFYGTDKRESDGIMFLLKLKNTDSLDLYSDLKIAGINSNALPSVYSTFVMNEVSIVIKYPLPQDLPLYIAQMNKHLNVIITAIKSKNFNKVIEHLSYYIQIGSVAHLFERANMSIILLQANVILNEIGYPGIYHRYLDLIGSALQPEEFFIFFKNYINDPENWVQ